MSKSQKGLLILTLVILLGGLYFLWNTKNKQINSRLGLINENKDEISQTKVSGVYTNQEYGFHFTYPTGWHTGADNLGQGVLQLFNYEESKESGSVFSVNMNKIEAAIVAKSSYESSSSDYPEKTHKVTEIVIAEQKAKRIEVELVGGEKILSYIIPLVSNDGKFIAITIYGDPSNFYVLEDLISSFGWLQ